MLKEDFEEINYWLEQLQDDLNCYDSPQKLETVRRMFSALAIQDNLRYYILDGRKGVIAYHIVPDFKGNLTLNELFLYIKPEHRGSIKLFKELINHIEDKAKEFNCLSVRIGANLNYKDRKILNALKLLGYETDVVVKYL